VLNFLLFSAAWMAVAGSVMILLVLRHRALKPLKNQAPLPTPWPELRVIVPARNEADNIEHCLGDLARQTYPDAKYEVLIVDDSSTDDTYQRALQVAAKNPNLHVVRAGPLPEGWLGKPHACWVGAEAARGEWLCFLDADTRLDPDLLKLSVTQAQACGIDLLSLHPQQRMLTFWERLLMPVPFMTLMLLMDAGAINDPDSRRAMANGQFILVRRGAYFAVGGHQALRSAVLDDVRLAELVKGAGFRIQLLGGGDLIQTRMYRDLRALWQGLARSGSELFGVPLTTAAILNSIVFGFFPFVFPCWLGVRLIARPELWAPFILAVCGSLLWYTAHAVELRRHKVPLQYLLLLPLSYVLIAVVNTEGVIRRLAGGRIWKDRRI